MGWKLSGKKPFSWGWREWNFNFLIIFLPSPNSTSDSVIIFSNYQACLFSFFVSFLQKYFLLHTHGNSKSFSCQKLYEIVIILPLPNANEAVEKMKRKRKKKGKRKTFEQKIRIPEVKNKTFCWWCSLIIWNKLNEIKMNIKHFSSFHKSFSLLLLQVNEWKKDFSFLFLFVKLCAEGFVCRQKA